MKLKNIFILFGVMVSAGAEVPESQVGGELIPIFAILETAAWPSSDSVSEVKFVAYENGTVIYQSLLPKMGARYVSRKSQFDLAMLTSALVSSDHLEGLFELTNDLDQPTTRLWTKTKSVEIYGDWREHARGGANRLPESVVGALIVCEELRNIPGQPWLPAKFEIHFNPYPHSISPPIFFPECGMVGQFITFRGFGCR